MKKGITTDGLHYSLSLDGTRKGAVPHGGTMTFEGSFMLELVVYGILFYGFVRVATVMADISNAIDEQERNR